MSMNLVPRKVFFTSGIGRHTEHHAFGQTKAAAGKYAEQLARSMYHTWTNVLNVAVFVI